MDGAIEGKKPFLSKRSTSCKTVSMRVSFLGRPGQEYRVCVNRARAKVTVAERRGERKVDKERRCRCGKGRQVGMDGRVEVLGEGCVDATSTAALAVRIPHWKVGSGWEEQGRAGQGRAGARAGLSWADGVLYLRLTGILLYFSPFTCVFCLWFWAQLTTATQRV